MPAVQFHRPYLTGKERTYIDAALSSGHLRGDGPNTERASALLAEQTGDGAVLLTPSCTHALELSALLLDLAPGDEVIMPSFTFVSTANAYVLRGVTPVFVDIDPARLGIDPAAVAAAITPRTKAIVAVHYAGIACDMTALCDLADRHGVALIEDNAHGLGGTFGDRPLGSLGTMSAVSFHDTKNVQCGEGGALVVNDPDLVLRAEILREKGTNRRAFLRGQVDRYSWVDVGSSYLLGEVLAAMLVAQLEGFDHIQQRRHEIWSAYHERLGGWAADHGVTLPAPVEGSVHAAHLFHLLLPDTTARGAFLDHMAANGIGSAFHYVPLHSTDLAHRLGHRGELPVTDAVAGSLARLPLYPDLTDDEVDAVVDTVVKFTP